MECLNCKKPITQTKGKRSRLYCSDKCRVTFYRTNASEGVPKKGRGRPRKIDAGVLQAEIKAVREQVKKSPFTNLRGTSDQSAPRFMGHEIPKGLKGIDLSIWKAEVKEKTANK